MSFSLVFFGVGIIYIYMAIHTLSKRMDNSTNRLHFFISILFALWALISGTMFLITDPIIAANARKYMVFSWGLVFSVILHLLVNLSGLQAMWCKRKPLFLLYGLLYIPCAINVYLYFFKPYVASELLLTTSGWIISDYTSKGFLWDNYFYFYYIICMASSMMILLYWHNKTIQLREKKQSKLLLVSFIIAFIGGSSLEIILPLYGIATISGITIIVALIPIFAIWFSIRKHGLMNFDPEHLAIDMVRMMKEGLILCDTHGIISSMNHGAKNTLAYEKIDRIEHIEDLGISLELLEEVVRLEDVNLISKDGVEVPVMFNSMNLYDSVGEHYGYMVVFQDISSLKHIQAELSKLNEALEVKVEERTFRLQELNRELMTEINVRKQTEQHNLQLAYYDHLTDLPNIRSFTNEIDRRIKVNNNGHRFAVLFMDIDDFKSINDTLGHSVGDQLLIQIAKRFKTYIGNGSYVARNGGDEFTFLLDEKGSNIGFDKQINDVLDKFKESFEIGNQTLNISCSIGAAIYPDHSKDREKLVRYSDIAMYRAKAHGRSAYSIFSNTMKIGLKQQLELTNDLHYAVERNELVMYYQPQINYDTGDVFGVEALVRWNHPTRGLLPPKEFIGIAETTGLIESIGAWIIESAMLTYVMLRSKGYKFSVSINLSMNQLKNGEFLKTVERVKEAHSIDMAFIEFEVTENLVLDQSNKSIESLEKLVAMGSSIALDDFGIEYSSLNYVKLLPINVIKIDKAFIDGIGNNRADEAIVKTIIALAENLGFEVIAEGVEEGYQLEFLKANNCTIIQGYYYSKPLSVENLITYLVEIDENKSLLGVNNYEHGKNRDTSYDSRGF